jgi:hypothetical protein
MKDHPRNRIIGSVPFIDGFDRDVYEDAQGWQYVIDCAGEHVYGRWLHPADELTVEDE